MTNYIPMFRDSVIVQNRRHVQDPYGGHYEDDGPSVTLTGVDVEARPYRDEGEKLRILCRHDEWPGNINSLITWHGHEYDAVGAPIIRPHGMSVAHTVVTARRID